jgi:D-cysteine desulfhydrase
LADAIQNNRYSLVSVVPYGSNFAAALSAQSQKLKMDVYLSQFIVQKNLQVDAHDNYCLRAGASATNYHGKIAAPLAVLDGYLKMVSNPLSLSQPKPYWVAPGGSSMYGTLGHTQAVLELKSQIDNNEIPEPDYIVVGVGTCGTMAGISAGLKLAGLKSKLIGVRAADRIVCNKKKIAGLANQVFEFLSSPFRLNTNEICLLESPLNRGYGYPTGNAQNLISEFYDLEQIHLDTTYTAKVVLFLKEQLLKNEFVGQNVLYWHTYSPIAFDWTQKETKSHPLNFTEPFRGTDSKVCAPNIPFQP